VGTTNVTTAQDYLAACGPKTALVLLVHSSNFAVRGFAAKPSVRELRRVFSPGMIFLADQGSGNSDEGLGGEQDLRRLLREGADLVCFSGDKVLGGPQSGLIAGNAALVAKLAKHPMMRAFRPGKTILSLMETVLVERLSAKGRDKNPPTAVLSALWHLGPGKKAGLERLGARLLKGLPADRAAMEPSRATIGGGSSPDESLDSLAIALKPLRSAAELASLLRSSTPPMIARVEKELVYLDLLTLVDENPSLILASITRALEAERSCRDRKAL